VVTTTGKREEEYKRQTKERIFGETKPNKNRTDKCTNTEKENKNENNKDYNKEKDKNEEKDMKSEDKRFSSMKEALNGISQELIQKHKAANTTC
jgi:hypothetical protein